MVYHKKKIIWFLVILIIFLGLFFSRSILRPKTLIPSKINNLNKNSGQEKLKSGTIQINKQIINVEIAKNDEQWYQGLSNRGSLCADCGMYFIFPDKNKLEFVMRDMKFPLDIIFIEDNKIINIAANLAPEGDKTNNIYSSNGQANRVLEVNAGYCNKYGIKTGDFISEINL